MNVSPNDSNLPQEEGEFYVHLNEYLKLKSDFGYAEKEQDQKNGKNMLLMQWHHPTLVLSWKVVPFLH